MTDSQTILTFVFFGMVIAGGLLLCVAGVAIGKRIWYAVQDWRIGQVRKAGL